MAEIIGYMVPVFHCKQCTTDLGYIFSKDNVQPIRLRPGSHFKCVACGKEFSGPDPLEIFEAFRDWKKEKE